MGRQPPFAQRRSPGSLRTGAPTCARRKKGVDVNPPPTARGERLRNPQDSRSGCRHGVCCGKLWWFPVRRWQRTMRALTRTYWAPIVAAVLMVTAVGVWAWQAMRGFHDMSEERPRRFAFGVFDTLQGTLRALGDHGRFRRGQVERVLRGTTDNSPVRFVVVEQDGERIFQVGDAPSALSLPTDTGETLGDDVSIFWRRVRLQDDAEGGAPTEGAVSDAMFDVKLADSDQTMVLGIGPPRDRQGPPPPMRGISVTLVVVLLFVGASTVAWIMAIRSGLLAEQLEVEQARRSHLEELGLAAGVRGIPVPLVSAEKLLTSIPMSSPSILSPTRSSFKLSPTTYSVVSPLRARPPRGPLSGYGSPRCNWTTFQVAEYGHYNHPSWMTPEALPIGWTGNGVG